MMDKRVQMLVFCCAWLEHGNSLNICDDIWGELWAQG